VVDDAHLLDDCRLSAVRGAWTGQPLDLARLANEPKSSTLISLSRFLLSSRNVRSISLLFFCFSSTSARLFFPKASRSSAGAILERSGADLSETSNALLDRRSTGGCSI
jgi:hypothetical protein